MPQKKKNGESKTKLPKLKTVENKLKTIYYTNKIEVDSFRTLYPHLLSPSYC